MMAGLGLVMLISPDLLSNMFTAVFLLVGALFITFVVTRFEGVGPTKVGKPPVKA